MPTFKFMKKTLPHITLNLFCLLFLRTHHDYFFWRGFESTRAQFVSWNISESSISCNLPVQLRFTKVNFLHVENGIWCCLEYRFCQINGNSSFLVIQRLQKHSSFCSAFVFWYVLFYKNLIVLHHGDILFYFILTSVSNPYYQQ